MGTPDFAAPSLKLLIESPYEVCAVATQPDKPKGRGMVLTPPPVRVLALAHNIPVFQPERLNSDFAAKLKEIAPDMIVVAAYGKILPKSVLEIPKYGCINVHASLLPKYRGAAPINWAIINGEKETGITTMLMDEGMDTGKMLLKESVKISNDDTAGTLHDKLKEVGANLLIKTLDALRNGTIAPIEQDDSLATYAPMIKKEDGRIDWTLKAEEIKNLIRGLNPLPCAYTRWEGKQIKIFKAEVEAGVKEEPGTIINISTEGIFVAAGRGTLLITELQMENKNRMSASEFIKGYRIVKGQILN
ncbi:MAG: methionyl-tRNA formyltransferase [Deltaproteobacteria bacterium]|nr:methionyl-tRNA formyltransferase [Deltaproteobacteria bacterium]